MRIIIKFSPATSPLARGVRANHLGIQGHLARCALTFLMFPQLIEGAKIGKSGAGHQHNVVCLIDRFMASLVSRCLAVQDRIHRNNLRHKVSYDWKGATVFFELGH